MKPPRLVVVLPFLGDLAGSYNAMCHILKEDGPEAFRRQ